MFKTFSDFVRKASRMYDLPFEIAEHHIVTKLQSVGLNTEMVVCYINWADGSCLSQKQIGKRLGISQPAVQQHLKRLRSVWPHLFQFGPKIPAFRSRRSSHGRTMGQLRGEVSGEIEKF